MVLALAGDSTITRLVLPLTIGPSLLAALLRVVEVDARVVVERAERAAPVLVVFDLDEVVVPLFLVVVAISLY